MVQLCGFTFFALCGALALASFAPNASSSISVLSAAPAAATRHSLHLHPSTCEHCPPQFAPYLFLGVRFLVERLIPPLTEKACLRKVELKREFEIRGATTAITPTQQTERRRRQQTH